MLTEKENEEILEHLNKAQNPLFYFDNDQDGLSSFLLLRRFLGRGKGVPVKTSPLDMNYFRRVEEFNPDYVFILDQPTVCPEFLSALRERNLPVVWIDHHALDDGVPEWVNYYNPLYSKSKTNEPVTDLCYRISKREEDLWIMIVGCIADKFVPEDYKAFLKKYPDLAIESSDAFEIFYKSEIGKISRMFGAGLKDKTTNVMKMVRFLSKVKTPYEVLEESGENREMHLAFSKIENKIGKLLDKIKENLDDGEVLFFTYSGETSMSADLANRLSFLYPEKTIVVGFIKGARVNFSIRGKSVREKVLQVIGKLPLATGGGHEDAVGVQIGADQLEIFEKEIKKILSGQ